MVGLPGMWWVAASKCRRPVPRKQTVARAVHDFAKIFPLLPCCHAHVELLKTIWIKTGLQNQLHFMFLLQQVHYYHVAILSEMLGLKWRAFGVYDPMHAFQAYVLSTNFVWLLRKICFAVCLNNKWYISMFFYTCSVPVVQCGFLEFSTTTSWGPSCTTSGHIVLYKC